MQRKAHSRSWSEIESLGRVYLSIYQPIHRSINAWMGGCLLTPSFSAVFSQVWPPRSWTMFVLVELEDTIRVSPSQLSTPAPLAVAESIRSTFLDKVVDDLGLAITLSSISKVRRRSTDGWMDGWMD